MLAVIVALVIGVSASNIALEVVPEDSRYTAAKAE